MKNNWLSALSKKKQDPDLVVLVASAQPRLDVLETLGQHGVQQIKEAFSTRGVLQDLPGVRLVILDKVLPVADTSAEILNRTLEMSGFPQIDVDGFLTNPEEWLGRARLANAGRISYLPARQVNLVNWSGGVGKTTLAMAICKRFVARTGLPAALLELSMGGSALHARISHDLPEFYAIATHKEEPAQWSGVSLYPMDGRTIDVLWEEDAQMVGQVLVEIRRKHTLFVVDCFPGHPLFAELARPAAGLVNLVVTSPRDDALLQAHRLMNELPEPKHLVLNMTRNLAERAEGGVALSLPYNESWAHASDPRLADPLLELVYAGWRNQP
jgi:hypothetical protein